MNDLQTFDFSGALEIIQEGGRVARDTWAESTFLSSVAVKPPTSGGGYKVIA